MPKIKFTYQIKMENKNIYLTFLALFSIIFMFSMVSATLTQPASSSTIAGTVAVLNATNATTLGNMVNCTFYAQSASTANSSWANLGFVSNLTANALNLNLTFNSNTLEDSNDYIFNATCKNLSNSGTSSLTTAVTIDNTAPAAPSALSPATNTLQTTSTTQNFSSTVINANTTSCTYVIARGGASSGSDYITGAGTYSGTTCSFTKAFTTTNDNGNWIWYTIASDGTNTTSASAINYNFQTAPNAGGVANSAQANAVKNQQALAIGGSDSGSAGIGIIVIIILVAIGIVYFIKK